MVKGILIVLAVLVAAIAIWCASFVVRGYIDAGHDLERAEQLTADIPKEYVDIVRELETIRLGRLHDFPRMRSLRRIAVETLWSVGADLRLDEDQKARIYLIKIYMGQRGGPIYGMETAARAYYGRPARELTRAEWMTLVAMIRSPNIYSVTMQPERNRQRVEALERLLAAR